MAAVSWQCKQHDQHITVHAFSSYSAEQPQTQTVCEQAHPPPMNCLEAAATLPDLTTTICLFAQNSGVNDQII